MHEDWGSKLVNMTDYNHNRPLHIAAEKGNISSLKVRRKREKREREHVQCICTCAHVHYTVHVHTM